jgi:hypothetical protein
MTDTITAFKGFDKYLKCRGFQYVEGETYVQDQPARLCSTGFHAVLLPLDVLKYYAPGTSVYHAVELADVDPKREGDSKVAGRKIKIGASVDIAGLVKAHVSVVWDLVKKPSDKTAATTGDSANAATTGRYANAATTGYSANAATTGRYAHAATTGYSAHAATTGDSAHAATTGDSANAATTGRYANAATTGRYAHAATTGYSAHAATTGDYANAATTGDSAHAATTGDSAHAATTGDSAHAATTGRYANAATTGYSANVRASAKDKDAIAAVLGQGAASGVIGGWLVLTERDDELNILDVKAVQVDGETVQADVFYTLRDGKVVTA